MNKIDLNSLTVDELKKLKENANFLLQNKQDEQVKKAYLQFQEIAKSVGVTPEEVIRKGKTLKTKRPAKYRNTDDASQTWSGQGRKPKWLEAQLSQGKSIEDFLIK